MDTEDETAGKYFWPTVGKIVLAAIDFAIYSILAVVAIVLGLQDLPLDDLGGTDGG